LEARQLNPTQAHPPESPDTVSESGAPTAEGAPVGVVGTAAGDPAASRRRAAAWVAFVLIAFGIVVSDQLLKAWIVGNYAANTPSPVLGDWLQIDFIHNAGGLFGVFQNSAPVFALVSLAVVAFIVGFEYRSGWTNWLVTLAMALLLGGAIGNFLDRIRLGYVVDFADLGIGTWRWYIFNVADSAITISIVGLLLLSVFAPRAIASGQDRKDQAAG
jgi:signal peptidase II